MSNVYVLGAGASHGEHLEVIPERQWSTTYFRHHTHCEVSTAPNPPLINGFFASEHLWLDPWEIEHGIDGHRSSYAELIAYIRRRWRIEDPFGSGEWRGLSVEDVFTTLAIENEFSAPETTARAVTQILINKMKRYIHAIVAHSTMCRYGRYTKLLAGSLFENDTVINFNYDLLMDQELLGSRGVQYETFSEAILEQEPARPSPRSTGTYLKMRGSINWLVCTNPNCRESYKIKVGTRTDWSTYETGINTPPPCGRCQCDLTSLLLPPAPGSGVMQTPAFRSIWGLALSALTDATNIVVIGFSFSPSDSYAEWLFRKAIRKDARVWVVNPLNTREFRDRMSSIFRFGYDHTYRTYEEIERLLRVI